MSPDKETLREVCSICLGGIAWGDHAHIPDNDCWSRRYSIQADRLAAAEKVVEAASRFHKYSSCMDTIDGNKKWMQAEIDLRYALDASRRKEDAGEGR